MGLTERRTPDDTEYEKVESPRSDYFLGWMPVASASPRRSVRLQQRAPLAVLESTCNGLTLEALMAAHRAIGVGMSVVAAFFLAISVTIETAYSWRFGLTDPYYLVKVVGWALLGLGILQLRRPNPEVGVVLLAAGWAWLGANFWRALADRVTRLAAGDELRLGSVELWFASGCLLVCLIGLAWSITVARWLRQVLWGEQRA